MLDKLKFDIWDDFREDTYISVKLQNHLDKQNETWK
jgi:hypothetical protein